MNTKNAQIHQPLRIRQTAAKAIVKAVELLYAVDAVDYTELQNVRIALNTMVRRGEVLPEQPEDKLVTQEQVAESLNVGLSTLKRLLSSGEITIPRKMVGGSVRYRWKDVVAFMNSVDYEEEGKPKA